MPDKNFMGCYHPSPRNVNTGDEQRYDAKRVK